MTDDPWSEIATPTRGNFSARPDPGNRQVWYAVDEAGRRHLLLELDSGADGPARIFTTRGLTATIERLAPAGGDPGPWIEIACTDAAINASFSVLAAEILDALGPGIDTRSAVLRVLDRWRWFWSNRPGPLTDTEALGLFAELWFLHRWVDFAIALPHWRGPLGDRHDFVHPEVSVEVKATRVRSDGPAQHRITHLDQLAAPESGQLYLFSLTASSDQLATNSLTRLVEILTAQAADAGIEPLWSERLAAAKWHPSHADRYRDPLRVLSEELYIVDEAFPRLTRNSFAGGSVPSGVDAVTYHVDLAAATRQRVTTVPPSPALRALSKF